MKSGIKNDPQDDPNLKSYINPNLIKNEFGNLTNLSQKLFQLGDGNQEQFVTHFFDYSVRTSAFVSAYCINLAKTGGHVDMVAAEGLYKVAQDIRTLGSKVVASNKDIFLANSKELYQKYHLEINIGYETRRTLSNVNYVYDSWFRVCQALVYVPKSLDAKAVSLFNQDIEVAVEAGAPALIWYLSGALDNEKHRWQSFVDSYLVPYWNDIPNKQKQTKN